MKMLDLYKNIKKRRIDLGLTQSELAEKTGYADKSMIAKIEKGLIDLPQSKIIAFAQVLDTKPSYLMGWDSSPYGSEKYTIFETNEDTSINKLLEKEAISNSYYEFETLIDNNESIFSLVTNLFSHEELKEWEAGINLPIYTKFSELQTTLDLHLFLTEDLINLSKKRKKNTSGIIINVLGRVAAGIPIESIEEIIDTEEISESLAKMGDFFGLRIVGDSMEPRMCTGDVVIVRQQEDAESGDIVIALVNGSDATCKRLMKYTSGISLVSLNSKYDPLIFSNKDIIEKPVKIIGKVVELRGKF